MVKRYLKDAVRFDLVHIGPAIDIAKEKCQRYYDIDLITTEGEFNHRDTTFIIIKGLISRSDTI